jgi:hypothetical protein
VNAELLVIGLVIVGLAGLALTQVEEGKGNGEHIFSIIFTIAIALGILLATISIFVKS